MTSILDVDTCKHREYYEQALAIPQEIEDRKGEGVRGTHDVLRLFNELLISSNRWLAW